MGPRLADETHNDKKQESIQTVACLVQVPPTEVVLLDDDDPIQSFSFSLSELLSIAADTV
jgi:hypothetical protein